MIYSEKKFIPYSKPSITDLEISYANDAAANGWGSKCYDYLNRFQQLFRDFLEVKYAIATSSCTGALHMGLAGLNVGKDHEVILADTNWIATAAPIVQLGASPVFVDILPNSWCIDPEKAEAAITSKTKAIIATHLYGNLCEMDRLLAIGRKYGIAIVEDSAEAIGSIYHGKHAGSMGTFGVFSFHGTKTLTTGEGGMFVTNDEKLYERVLTLSNHGRAKSQVKQFWPEALGYKYKMSNIQAAIGCAQLERIDELIQRKREILLNYRKKLLSFQEISMNPEPKGTVNGAWMPTVVFSEKTGVIRENLQAVFAEENIDARIFFWPISSFDMFKQVPENINSYRICEKAINLPSYHDITSNELDRIITTLLSVFDKIPSGK